MIRIRVCTLQNKHSDIHTELNVNHNFFGVWVIKISGNKGTGMRKVYYLRWCYTCSWLQLMQISQLWKVIQHQET